MMVAKRMAGIRNQVRAVLAMALALLCALILSDAATAQLPTSASTTSALAAQINRAEAEIRQVDVALDRNPDDEQQALLRARADAAGKAGAAAVVDLEEQIALLDARIAELGPVPAGGDAPEVARQRRSLAADRSALDASVRRGRLIAVGARQLTDELDRSRSEELSQKLSVQVASPITPGFWNAVLKAASRDFRRIHLFLSEGTDQVRTHWRGGVAWQLPLTLLLAFLILVPLRRAAARFALRFLVEDAPGHRVRRSANALQRIVIGTLAPTLAAIVVVAGMHWAGLLPERWNVLLDAVIGATGFGAFVVAVISAVLMASQPSWRVAPIGDAAAARLQSLVWPLGLLSAASILIVAFNKSVGASAAAVVATQGIEAMLRLALLVTALLMLGRLRARQDETPEGDAGDRSTPPALSLLILISWLIVGWASFALLLGYVNLASFILQLFGWALVLGCAVYLLARAADDITTTVFSRGSGFGHAITRTTGLRPSVVDQFGLLASGVLRLAIYLVGLGLLFTPFGAGGGVGALFGRLGTLAQGIEVGGISISPGAILRGVVVLAIGLALVRAFMRWLEERYLPATELDGSSRDSVSLITRYVGIALAVIWALASLGIGVERIALLLSALSVGIGFGLQAITQNFVSGLILLAERPIKIGDLIRVGVDEGDVKRINVRSTEIELADHSTLIVPNSELITKSVLNKTRASALGRVQIQFSVPLGVDVRKVRQIVLDTFAAEDAILKDPGSAVFIDSIADGRVLFNCFAHTSNPRSAYGTRSGVFLALLSTFHDEGIDIGTPAQRLELLPGPDGNVAPSNATTMPAAEAHAGSGRLATDPPSPTTRPQRGLERRDGEQDRGTQADRQAGAADTLSRRA